MTNHKGGFIIFTANDIIYLGPLDLDEEYLPFMGKMEETSGRATGEGSVRNRPTLSSQV